MGCPYIVNRNNTLIDDVGSSASQKSWLGSTWEARWCVLWVVWHLGQSRPE